MKTTFYGEPLAPKSPAGLMVLIIARISTVHQDVRSLADQIALCEGHVRAQWPGPVRFDRIQSRGSGELLDTLELAQAEQKIESGVFDLVVVEDLGRICRRTRAIDICEMGLDAHTRLIAINDSLDTARDGWRLSAFFASIKAETHNEDTAKRIRRSLRNRFVEGDVVQTLPWGYVKLPESSRDRDLQKHLDGARVIGHVFDMLEAEASLSEVADWMNAESVPTGEWMRTDKWTCSSVGRLVRNPILKGVRQRNQKISQRVHKSGRHKSVTAPSSERLFRDVPHLAYIEPGRYDRVVATLARRNVRFRRDSKGGVDPRAGVPKKRTVWPGQHAVCGVCGRPFYWGGHGQKGHMSCSGTQQYRCWNVATFDGHLAGEKIRQAVLAAIESFPGFDDDVARRYSLEVQRATSSRADRSKAAWAALDEVGRQIGKLLDVMLRVTDSSSLEDKLRELEAVKRERTLTASEIEAEPTTDVELPTAEAIRVQLREALSSTDFSNPAAHRTLCAIVPSLVVRPCRLADGNALACRAELTVRWVPPTVRTGEAVEELTHSCSVDLFDAPQRAAHRAEVVALRAQGLNQREVGRRLGLTQPAVQNAIALDGTMREKGLGDPYELLTEPPTGKKFKRQNHARFRFDPLPGFPVWTRDPEPAPASEVETGDEASGD